MQSISKSVKLLLAAFSTTTPSRKVCLYLEAGLVQYFQNLTHSHQYKLIHRSSKLDRKAHFVLAALSVKHKRFEHDNDQVDLQSGSLHYSMCKVVEVL